MPLSSYKPDNYQALLEQKTARLQHLLTTFEAPPLTVFASPASGFRMRAEFRFWHENNDCFYVMFNKGDSRTPARIDHFPIAHDNLNRLMQSLRAAVMQSDTLRHKLFQVDFLTTLTNDNLITLIYHRKLDGEWEAAATLLEKTLGAAVIGRSRQQRIVISKDYVDETLTVNERPLHYRQLEGGFTQPNARINEKMLGWAIHQAGDNIQGDLLELYCGNGNFTVALAGQFGQVLATEISKPSVQAAQFNFARNGIKNAKVCRLASEEITAALNGTRTFRRLAENGINLDDYQFSTVLVDPPRAGLDPATLALVQRFERIIYISCNPHTLADNLHTLCQTHRIEQAALFDQFPYTEHIETGVHLVRKQ